MSESPRVILLDEDPIFGIMMERQAEIMGIELDYYESLASLGFISQPGNYDIIIVDYQINHINGIEIAAYVRAFFENKPVFLISSTDLGQKFSELPSYVTGFLPKQRCFQDIINQALVGYETKVA